MQVQLSYYSSRGGRAANEDSVSVLESGNSVLAAVADGLGGHGRGDEASRCATAVLNSCLKDQPVSEAALQEAVQEANRQVLALQKNFANMQTTLTALWLGNQQAIGATVGDSRLYQFRGGSIVHQSTDHSVAQIAVMTGEITENQIRGYRGRSQLIRTIGMNDILTVDTCRLKIREGDSFLLCTDGFWENITEAEMLYYLIHTGSAADWLQQMRDYVEACAAETMDNHSAVVLRIV